MLRKYHININYSWRQFPTVIRSNKSPTLLTCDWLTVTELGAHNKPRTRRTFTLNNEQFFMLFSRLLNPNLFAWRFSMFCLVANINVVQIFVSFRNHLNRSHGPQRGNVSQSSMWSKSILNFNSYRNDWHSTFTFNATCERFVGV